MEAADGDGSERGVGESFVDLEGGFARGVEFKYAI